MGIDVFFSIMKDAFMLVISAISSVIGAFFSMPLFFNGSYIISVGQVATAIILASILFGFIFSSITDYISR